MFDAFQQAFPPDAGRVPSEYPWTEDKTLSLLGVVPEGYTEWVAGHAVPSYGNGVIRFLLPDTSPSLLIWNGAAGWASDWVSWKGRLVVFAFDWLGRQFAFDRGRIDPVSQEPLIAVLEPGTGYVLEVPETFQGFMERELVQYPDAALATDFYREWLGRGGQKPGFSACIGYKVPLFLGGEDGGENLELSPLSVYLSLMGQLFHKSA